MRLILASQSSSRRAMLTAAGIDYDAMTSDADEDQAKLSLRAQGLGAPELAEALAEVKAMPLSLTYPDALILGCDQTLSLDDGSMIDKAVDKSDAVHILRRFSGRDHQLHSAAVVMMAGKPIWRAMETATMSVRPLSDRFIAAYVEQEWEHVRWCVGCYRIEGPGVQLFSAVSGSQFAIQGLPLIALLDFLRARGVLET